MIVQASSFVSLASILLLSLGSDGIREIEFAGPSSVCSDAAVEGREQCDDGGHIDGDGCQANCILPLGSVGDFVSDDFAACPVTPAPWVHLDPFGLATVRRTSPAPGEVQLELSIPAGTAYDGWPNAGAVPVNQALAAIQPLADDDEQLEVEVRFFSEPTAQFNDQGLFFEAGAPGCSADPVPCDWLRFDVYGDGGRPWTFGGKTIGGTNHIEFYVRQLVGATKFVRVARDGDRWDMWISPDGAAWSFAGGFNQALAVTTIGIFAGNVTATSAFNARIDYVMNVADPIVPEDGGGFGCDDADDACTADSCPYDGTSDLWECANETTAVPGCTCGDGQLAPNGLEACDDGDAEGGDGCSASCDVEAGWACEGEPSSCTSLCGNGVLDASETCDDGGVAGGDGCSTTCAIETGWSCAGEPSVCDGVCGDGLLRGTEACDDGNANGGDGCDGVCSTEAGWACAGEPSECGAVCGDGLVRGAEGCDDGGAIGGDGCSAYCFVEPGWGCAGEPSGCAAICGDGLVAGAEACDDGNTDDGDGCSSACMPEAGCPSGTIDPGEECDDGNAIGGDGCEADCTVTTFVRDGGFDAGLGSWFSFFEGNSGSLAVQNGEAVVTLGPTKPWNRQMFQILPYLEGRQGYRLSFDVRTTADTWIQVRLLKDNAPFQLYGLDRWVELTGTAWQKVEIAFSTPPDFELPEPRLMLLFGWVDPGTVLRFDNFRLERVAARCGDAVLQAGEECDSGAANSLSGACTLECKLGTTCGNGIMDAGEACDAGGASAACDADCTLPVCGDGQLNTTAGETCDDGNDVDVDRCTATCAPNANHVVNGDFSDELSHWSFFTDGAGMLSVVEPPGGGYQGSVAITVPGNNVQLFQSGILLDGDTDYRLTFTASSEHGEDLLVRLIKNRPPNVTYGLVATIDLTDVPQTFTLDFRTTAGRKNDARLAIKLLDEAVATVFRFEDVRIEAR